MSDIERLQRACNASLEVISRYQKQWYDETGDPFILDGMDSGLSGPITLALKDALGLPVEFYDYQTCQKETPILTDEELEAVRFFSLIDGPGNIPVANKRAATLRKLLERLTKPPAGT
jgi:hypothetical protein